MQDLSGMAKKFSADFNKMFVPASTPHINEHGRTLKKGDVFVYQFSIGRGETASWRGEVLEVRENCFRAKFNDFRRGSLSGHMISPGESFVDVAPVEFHRTIVVGGSDCDYRVHERLKIVS